MRLPSLSSLAAGIVLFCCAVAPVSAQTPAPTPVLEVDPEVERDQIARLRAFRASRDSAPVAAALAAVESDARQDRNLMPGLIAAVEAHATLGEIVATLKTVFGEQGVPASRK